MLHGYSFFLFMVVTWLGLVVNHWYLRVLSAEAIITCQRDMKKLRRHVKKLQKPLSQTPFKPEYLDLP